MVDVSIVIVCMNRPDILYPCLDSIAKQTKASYETFVVAYMFSEENLKHLREDYPWVKVVVSNELRGFAENNNLALRMVSGRFCFVANDDTLMDMPVVDLLLEDFDRQPSAAAISPRIVYPDGRLQNCGRKPFNGWTYISHYFHFRSETRPSRWTMREGLFRTYGLNGACFMLRTEVFRSLGWFDETYMFTPEDIALGTMLNKGGWEVWADADVCIYHAAGASTSQLETAIKPTRVRGSLIFYSSLASLRNPQGKPDNRVIYFMMGCAVWLFEAARGIKYLFKDCSNPVGRNALMAKTARNVRRSVFSSRSPKEIFVEYYNKLQDGDNE